MQSNVFRSNCHFTPRKRFAKVFKSAFVKFILVNKLRWFHFPKSFKSFFVINQTTIFRNFFGLDKSFGNNKEKFVCFVRTFVNFFVFENFNLFDRVFRVCFYEATFFFFFLLVRPTCFDFVFRHEPRRSQAKNVHFIPPKIKIRNNNFVRNFTNESR